MLERSDWLLTPWKQTDPESGVGATPSYWQREILDRATGTSLGFARRQVVPKTGLWPWNRAPRFEVHEIEDASHLFTLTRSWWGRPRWNVLDAEDTLVGRIRCNQLLDPWGRGHGRLSADGLIRDVDGHTLASLRREGDALRVLLVDMTASPFWKMMLLGMSVLYDACPAND